MIHKPVMVDEIVSIFADIPDGLFIDATFGFGGHTKAIKEKSRGRLRFLGIDRDGEILGAAGREGPESVTLKRMNFAELPSYLENEIDIPVSGILFDLGLNSAHIDDPSRGFSYQASSPLDLRFDRSTGLTAAQMLGDISESELISILKNYGQERNARSIARDIIDSPPSTTGELADIIKRRAGARRFNESAARVFQALRIAVNDELESLEKGLSGCIPRLCVGGRIAVISYHSLEDGIVKRLFALNSGKCFCGPEIAICNCGKRKLLEIKTKKPLRPTESEVKENSRARSARLRYAERIEEEKI